MVTSLLEFERIHTTLPKAKALRGIAERMITLGKKGTLADRRRAAAYVKSENVLSKLFSVFSERYKERPGGYTRVFKLGVRNGDSAPMAMIELVDRDPNALAKKRVRRVAVKDEIQN